MTTPSSTEATAPTLPAAMRAAVASHPPGVALRSPSAADPGALSYADVARAADEIAAGLAALGIEAGDRVAILAGTRAEWTLADVGALSAGATVVPIYNSTVGRPLPGTEVRVASDGELLVRGPHVFAGYYRDDEATSDTLAEGWLHTGDLGAVDDDGFVRITGRKKELIITSSGKNISPTNIEELLRETRWISQAIAFGDNRPYLVALLTLDGDEAVRLAERVGAPSADLAALSRHPGVRAELQASVDAVNERLARIEQIKRFAILDHDLSQAAGELTPTLKIKRRVVAEHYHDLVKELYS